MAKSEQGTWDQQKWYFSALMRAQPPAVGVCVRCVKHHRPAHTADVTPYLPSPRPCHGAGSVQTLLSHWTKIHKAQFSSSSLSNSFDGSKKKKRPNQISVNYFSTLPFSLHEKQKTKWRKQDSVTLVVLFGLNVWNGSWLNWKPSQQHKLFSKDHTDPRWGRSTINK